jgi:chromosome segregation ATPase
MEEKNYKIDFYNKEHCKQAEIQSDGWLHVIGMDELGGDSHAFRAVATAIHAIYELGAEYKKAGKDVVSREDYAAALDKVDSLTEENERLREDQAAMRAMLTKLQSEKSQAQLNINKLADRNETLGNYLGKAEDRANRFRELAVSWRKRYQSVQTQLSLLNDATPYAGDDEDLS